MRPQLPIEVDEKSGVWATDGLPMLYVPRHFFVNNHVAIEAALGREAYAALLFKAGYKSAYFWCDEASKTHGLTGIAVFEHYLTRLSLRGWGIFSFVRSAPIAGEAEIRLDHSAFVLAQPGMSGRICYMFSGWFAGAMDWVTAGAGGRSLSKCHEERCQAEGHAHCVFAVRPDMSAPNS